MLKIYDCVRYFEQQLSLAEVTGLPLFLHCRDAAEDLVSILTPWRERIAGGVVHSFDGTSHELQALLDLDLYIGINGWLVKDCVTLNHVRCSESS